MSPCVRTLEPPRPRLAGFVLFVTAGRVQGSHQGVCGTSASLKRRLELILCFGWRVGSASRPSLRLWKVVGPSDHEHILFTSSSLPRQQHEIEHHPLLFLNVVHVFHFHVINVNFTVLDPADAENWVKLTGSVEIQTFNDFVNFVLDVKRVFNLETFHRSNP